MIKSKTKAKKAVLTAMLLTTASSGAFAYDRSAAEIAGDTAGGIGSASTIYGYDRYRSYGGPGFAAEDANHMHDRLRGRDARLVGHDNVKNGPDRIVDGQLIQTKYYPTGRACVEQCFDGRGSFRYLDAAGRPMQIEVPADVYDDAVREMADKIRSGRVPGVTDPAKANEIVRKGSVTFEQAKNIARFGTVESLRFDAVNGAVIATTSFGLSFAVALAADVWNGEKLDVALRNATIVGLKVGGTTFVTSVLASQLSRTALNSLLVGSTEAAVEVMGYKAAAMLANAFRSGVNIYGAAALKSAAKLLRGNIITSGITVVVLSSVDVVNIFRGRISGAQLFKNLTNTLATTAGGVGGWTGGASLGATIGSMICPGIGTGVGAFLGGLAGAFAGGSAANAATNMVLGSFIEDDAVKMTRILENEFARLAHDYLLNAREAEAVAKSLQSTVTGGTLKDMYASNDRAAFARRLLLGPVERVAANRRHIAMPAMRQVTAAMREVLEAQ